MGSIVKYPQSNDALWVNGSYAYSDDGSYTTATPAKNRTIDGNWFNFAFNLPIDAVITSIVIECQYKVDTTASNAIFHMQAYKGSTAMGSDFVDSSEPTSDTVVTNSECGSWTASELNDNSANGFNVRLGANRVVSNNEVTFSVDYVKVTIGYAAAYDETTRVETVIVAHGKAVAVTKNEMNKSSSLSIVTGNTALVTRGEIGRASTILVVQGESDEISGTIFEEFLGVISTIVAGQIAVVAKNEIEKSVVLQVMLGNQNNVSIIEQSGIEIVKTAVGKTDLAIRFETSKSQGILLIAGRSETVDRIETYKENEIVTLSGITDKMAFSETNKNQTLSAVTENISSTIFVETVKVQELQTVTGKTDTVDHIETGKTEVITAITNRIVTETQIETARVIAINAIHDKSENLSCIELGKLIQFPVALDKQDVVNIYESGHEQLIYDSYGVSDHTTNLESRKQCDVIAFPGNSCNVTRIEEKTQNVLYRALVFDILTLQETGRTLGSIVIITEQDTVGTKIVFYETGKPVILISTQDIIDKLHQNETLIGAYARILLTKAETARFIDSLGAIIHLMVFGSDNCNNIPQEFLTAVIKAFVGIKSKYVPTMLPAKNQVVTENLDGIIVTTQKNSVLVNTGANSIEVTGRNSIDAGNSKNIITRGIA